RPLHQTNDGRTGTKTNAASTGDHRIITHFIRLRMAASHDN
ncbi:MAG: hypothetical protein QOF69_3119, partial [Solirubrobacteraceae bacterium]|nr:hypothetical protein [Solirubrobacteraceae bacterium]